MGMENVEINSSKYELEKFKDSVIWGDIVQELSAWKEGFEMERSSMVDVSADANPSTATILMRLGDINGRVKAVDYLLSLPDVFISILEGEEDTQPETKEESHG